MIKSSLLHGSIIMVTLSCSYDYIVIVIITCFPHHGYIALRKCYYDYIIIILIFSLLHVSINMTSSWVDTLLITTSSLYCHCHILIVTLPWQDSFLIVTWFHHHGYSLIVTLFWLILMMFYVYLNMGPLVICDLVLCIHVHICFSYYIHCL